MYKYDEYDQRIIDERVSQYRDQTNRFLAGEIPADEFQQLRLRNGLYIQRLAPMLRIAIPYGMISSVQLRKIAQLARDYDKGYGHFTTRQNVQFNWPELADVPDILEALATVQMHAIQTSGSCIRNITTDQFAGVSADEIEDSRAYCEIIRQWSTFHPEFNWLPRKFKIAVSGCRRDRAATQVHDIGLRMKRNDAGDIGFEVLVGGGLGRTPVIASLIREFLPEKDLLTYLEAILRVYNRLGRRDNKYKARIKILVRAMTPTAFAAAVEEEWSNLKDTESELPREEVDRIKSHFTAPDYEDLQDGMDAARRAGEANPAFASWLRWNISPHKVRGYAIVTASLKERDMAPGDASSEQMELLADLADEYSFGELRVSHEQNIILADVRQDRLLDLWQALVAAGIGSGNIGTLTDMICCPGGDYCSLANAKSIPVARAIADRFHDPALLEDLGPLDVNISGCMNACGHHHVGNIGILGVDKKGEEFYQISLGGSGFEDASLGAILGPSLPRDAVPDAVDRILTVYREHRSPEERFIETCRRIGIESFREAVYPST